MPKKTSNDEEFQDQGSLDQPTQSVEDAAAPRPGPTNPTLDSSEENQPADLSQQEVSPTDDSSLMTLPKVNEARENGEPLDGSLNAASGDQPAVTPAGTGVSAGATAGTVDT